MCVELIPARHGAELGALVRRHERLSAMLADTQRLFWVGGVEAVQRVNSRFQRGKIPHNSRCFEELHAVGQSILFGKRQNLRFDCGHHTLRRLRDQYAPQGRLLREKERTGACAVLFPFHLISPAPETPVPILISVPLLNSPDSAVLRL